MEQAYVAASPKAFREVLQDLLFEGPSCYLHFHVFSHRSKKDGDEVLKFALNVGVPDGGDPEPSERASLNFEECTYSLSKGDEKRPRCKKGKKDEEGPCEAPLEVEKLVTPCSLPSSFGPEEVDLTPLVLEASRTVCKLLALEKTKNLKLSVLVPEGSDGEESQTEGSEDGEDDGDGDVPPPQNEGDEPSTDDPSQSSLLQEETEAVTESLTKKVLEALKGAKGGRG
jgi:hypothetical protein